MPDEIEDKIKQYASMSESYTLPTQMHGAGSGFDPETGHVLAIGFVARRETYAETGYICDKNAPQKLHACVCALLSEVQDMPLIKTALLSPEVILKLLCKEVTADEEIKRWMAFSLEVLNKALESYLSYRNSINDAVSAGLELDKKN